MREEDAVIGREYQECDYGRVVYVGTDEDGDPEVIILEENDHMWAIGDTAPTTWPELEPLDNEPDMVELLNRKLMAGELTEMRYTLVSFNRYQVDATFFISPKP